jgi:hypothetical protein
VPATASLELPVHRSTLVRSVLAMQFALALPGQDAGTAQQAAELREAATALWNSHEYRAASDKLQEADRIYRTLPGDWSRDRATVCRAIVHDEAMDGRIDAALQWLDTLAQLARPDVAELAGELRSAYGGIWQLAQRQQGVEAQVAIVQRARTVFGKRGQRILAAACLHDAGSLYGDADMLQPMRTALQAAAAERQQLGDLSGLGWTCNNRAHYELRAAHPDQAAASLLRGYELCARGEALECQQALAINLAGLFTAAHANEPAAGLVDALWLLTSVLCRSKQPFVFPPDRAVRETLLVEQRRNGGKGAMAAAERAAALVAAADWPVEVKADLQLRIAAVLLAGKADSQQRAHKLIDRLDLGRGPCAPHLGARRDALLAVLAARRDVVAEYDVAARKAIDAMTVLGDRATLLALLAEVTAALPAGRSEVRDALARQLDEHKRGGGPGGDGGSARTQAVGTVPADAGAHTPFFELSWDAEQRDVATLRDLVGGSSQKLSCHWKPHHSSFNGCGLGICGGYFVVRSMAYGGAAASAGAPGQSTLDELGSYLPLSADGAWQILQNGAVRFVPRK